MNLKRCYLTKNDCYKSAKKHAVRGIMVHSTGCNNPKISRYVPLETVKSNQWNKSGIEKCVHAFIGRLEDGSIATVQTLPFDIAGWHSGVGTLGKAKNANNTGYIGFEICEDALTDRAYFNKVYNEAVELCVYLCRLYNLSEKNILCHSEGYAKGIASNHADVMHWFKRFNKDMDDFRKDVKNGLKGNTSAEKSETDRVYTVKKGDSLWSIAKKYLGKGARYTEIVKLNNLKSNTITPGQKLKLP